MRLKAAGGADQPLPVTAAAVAALGDLCLAMDPTELDTRSNAAAGGAEGAPQDVQERLHLNSIDLLLHRMAWGAELAQGGVPLTNQDEATCDADAERLTEVPATPCCLPFHRSVHGAFVQASRASRFVQVAGRALGRLALRFAGSAGDAAAIHMEAVRVLDALLPAAVLGQRDDAAGRRATAWFGTCLDGLSHTAAGRRMLAYALVPAVRRAWAQHQAPDAVDRFLAVVAQLLALGDAPACEAAGAKDGDAAPPPPPPALEAPWLLDVQALLYAEVAATADATAAAATCVDARPYMAALLRFAASLAAKAQGTEAARSAAAHARRTEGVLEELQGAEDVAALLAAVQACAEALAAQVAQPDGDSSDASDDAATEDAAGPSDRAADAAGPSGGGAAATSSDSEWVCSPRVSCRGAVRCCNVTLPETHAAPLKRMAPVRSRPSMWRRNCSASRACWTLAWPGRKRTGDRQPRAGGPPQMTAMAAATRAATAARARHCRT